MENGQKIKMTLRNTWKWCLKVEFIKKAANSKTKLWNYWGRVATANHANLTLNPVVWTVEASQTKTVQAHSNEPDTGLEVK